MQHGRLCLAQTRRAAVHVSSAGRSLRRSRTGTSLPRNQDGGSCHFHSLPCQPRFLTSIHHRPKHLPEITHKASMSTTTEPSQSFRLPTTVKATHYDLTIVTDLEALTFKGVVKTSIDVKETTTTVVLNVDELVLGPASVTSLDTGKTQKSADNSIDVPKKRATFMFPEPLAAGSQAELTIAFSGKLGDSMTGYYRALSDPDASGNKQVYSLTQFEATDARRAFPCWDEPALKATYAVTLISRADSVNLSNMPAKSETVYNHENFELKDKLPTLANAGDKWKITKFETTPLMSTYLLAFANGPFKFIETSVKMPLSGKTVPLRVYTTPDLIHQAQFALDVKAKVLPLYEEIFDVEYPLPKLDTLVATDFDAGAMENWGLITGRTSAYLLDPNTIDIKAKRRIVTVQSHEVAHMWFGNITTMAWWDYLYLNEGFATLMGEVIIPKKAYPEFRPNTEFINDHLHAALALDAKLSSHPIEVPCPDADRIGQIFDSLSYSKAASVLRMLANFVGEEKFLKGVSLYLKDNLYGNCVTEDLWHGITKATGVDVVGLMDNWIKKIGFPVLTVKETPSGIQVRQDRFVETGLPTDEENQTIWKVPLSILTVNEIGEPVTENVLLEEREKTFNLDTSKPFKLNGGTFGVYRVLYEPERLTKIAIEAAKGDSVFSLDDRLGLVYDAVALSKAGLGELSSTLTLIDILRNEKEFLVWSGISTNLSAVSSVWWEHSQISDDLNLFKQSLFGPMVEKLGYEYSKDEPIDVTRLRTTAITAAAEAKHPKVLAELQRRFADFMKIGDYSSISPDIQQATFTAGLKAGGVAEYEALLKIHEAPKIQTSGIAARMALTQTKDPALLERTHQLMLDGVRDQDVYMFFAGLASNKATRRGVAEFFKKEYDAFYKRFEKNTLLKYLIQYSFASLSTQKDLDDTTAFFKDKDTSKYDLTLAQSLDSIRARIAFIEKSTKDLEGWLKEWKRKSSSNL